MAHEESLSPFCSNVYGASSQPNILPRVGEEYQAESVNFAVPESYSDTWNEIEQASFTLGLYIFGKQFVQVKHFVGSKDMKDLLSFYYGKFTKSDVYERWCECKKTKSRKWCNWHKLFTRSRQQDLVSRLQPNVAEDCYNKLLQVSEAFFEGEMGLEDYVLTLKDLVGMKALVEAVGIGKGKEDLAGFTADSMKSTQARPVIPVGKACSSLTPSEIISFNVHVLQEVDVDEPLMTTMVERQQANAGKKPDDPNIETISEAVDHSMHQLDMNAKSKSRRSTQPTIKVLEALAAGLRDMKEKRKRKVDLLDNLMPRRSQRTRLMAGETSHDGVPVPPDFSNEE